MAETNRERLKRLALIGFVAVCVGLIGLIWAEGLTGNEPATPSYYRDTFRMDENIYLTVTAQAIEFQNSLEQGTPPATTAPDEHNGSGSGQGQGSNHNDTPAATATPSGGQP
ncbi:MAG: hypothetical protein IT327_19650 [Anaerolineae bacterium]|nr:hypothetical protein [Anaerolineae bacterium]